MDAIVPPTANALAHSTRVPIAQLSPDLEDISDKSCLATVALVWPYSSSAKSVSLLLVEPDVRLRRDRGQIKVIFHGSVAQSVAESHVGIGDTVCLALKYSKFVSSAGDPQTPGSSVAWDAHFENGVSMEILPRSSENTLTISVAPQARAPHESELAPPTTPNGRLSNPEPDLAFSAGSWGSPAFLTSTRASFGEAVHSAFDPFAEEDGFVPGKGRKRPRYSLQRDDWRVLTESESPQEQGAPVDWQEALDQAIDQELAEADTTSEAPDKVMVDSDESLKSTGDVPRKSVIEFAKPSLELTGSILDRRADQSRIVSSSDQIDAHEISSQLPTDTPQIRPIPSPGLPIPSPLVSSHSSSAEYFPPWATSTQVQGVQSVATEIANVTSSTEYASESQDAEVVRSVQTETVGPFEPVAHIGQDHVLGAGFLLQENAALSPDLAQPLVDEHETESAEALNAPNEGAIAQADVSAKNIGDEVQILGEIRSEHVSKDYIQHGECSKQASGSESDTDDPLQIIGGLTAVQADADVVPSEDPTQVSQDRLQEDVMDESAPSRDQSEASLGSEDESDDPLTVIEGSPAAHADTDIEDANGAYSSSEQSISSTHSEDGLAENPGATDDIAQSNINNEIASDNGILSENRSISDNSEDHEPDVHSSDTSPQRAAFDQDAVEALEMMMATREEELEKNRNMEAPPTREDEIEDTSLAKGASSLLPNEVYSEGDEVLENEERYDERSSDEYESQYDYHEERQDNFSVDEFSESEQQSNLNSHPEAHEVIVLDSDSDDEPALSHPAIPTPRRPAEDSSYQAESVYSATPSATADSEMSGREGSGRWNVDGDSEYHEPVQDESNSDSDEHQENEQSLDAEHNQQDDRVYESDKMSDMDNESSEAPFKAGPASIMAHLSHDQQDADEEMEGADLFGRAYDDEFSSAVRPDSHSGMPVERELDQDQPKNIDANLAALSQPQHQLQSEKLQSEILEPNVQQRAPSGSEEYVAAFNGDQQPQPQIPPSTAHDAADLLSTEAAFEASMPHDRLVSVSITHEHKRQLMTPEPTQATAPTLEQPHDLLPETSLLAGNYDDRSFGLDIALQPTNSIEMGRDDIQGVEPALAPIEATSDLEQDDTQTTTTPEHAEPSNLPTTPQRSRSVEFLISTESPKPPAVVITRALDPDRNAAGLRSKLSYFAPLATLFDHYNALVDTISIVHEASPITRAKSGSKDWFVTIELTDPSMAGTTLRAQIFRRYKSSMPTLIEGTAILLRDFKVRSFDHNVMLVSVESSAWAVFNGSGPDAEMNGPPVEYDEQECAYASDLRRWYLEVGSGWIADRMLQASIERDSMDRGFSPSSQAASESSTPDSKRSSHRRRKGNQRVAIHELRDGTRYTDAGSPNSRNSSVHELRDGTLYANL